MSTVIIDGGSACPSQIHLTQGPSKSSKSQPPSRRGSLEIGQLLSAELGGEMLVPAGAPAPSVAAAERSSQRPRLIGEA